MSAPLRCADYFLVYGLEKGKKGDFSLDISKEDRLNLNNLSENSLPISLIDRFPSKDYVDAIFPTVGV